MFSLLLLIDYYFLETIDFVLCDIILSHKLLTYDK